MYHGTNHFFRPFQKKYGLFKQRFSQGTSYVGNIIEKILLLSNARLCKDSCVITVRNKYKSSCCEFYKDYWCATIVENQTFYAMFKTNFNII